MFFSELLAENAIREAMDRGEFTDLPGAGKPLCLKDDSMVPAHLRLAYKILRNAGCIPPELELRKEILTLRDLIRTIEADEEKSRKIRELNDKLLRLSLMSGRAVNLDDFPEYRERVLARLSGG
jgi:hypothetical protein